MVRGRGTFAPFDEDFVQIVLKSHPHGLAVADRAGTLTWTNSRFAGLAGADEPAVTGLPLHRLPCWDDDAEAARSLQKALFAGTEWAGVMRLRDGQSRHGCALLTVLPIGEQGGAASRSLVILEEGPGAGSEHTAEEALPDDEERFRQIFECVFDLIYSVRLEDSGEIVTEWVNSGRCRAFDFLPHAVTCTADLFRLVHPEDLPLMRQRLEGFAAGQDEVTELRLRMPDSSIRWVRDYGRPIALPGGGRRIRVLGAVQDITEQKAADEGRSQPVRPSPDGLKMESIVRLAGSVAHDLNNLLTVVNGYSALLLASMNRTQKSRLSVEKIHTAGERAAELVRQLLNEY